MAHPERTATGTTNMDTWVADPTATPMASSILFCQVSFYTGAETAKRKEEGKRMPDSKGREEQPEPQRRMKSKVDEDEAQKGARQPKIRATSSQRAIMVAVKIGEDWPPFALSDRPGWYHPLPKARIQRVPAPASPYYERYSISPRL